MATPFRPSTLQHCTSCFRRLRANLSDHAMNPQSQFQIRGKKKMVRGPDVSTVRLLQDVPTFGRKGSVVPVSVGLMRNDWYPRRVAEYVPYMQKKELKTNNVALERDFEFLAEQVARKGEKAESDAFNDAVRQELAKQQQRTIELERVSVR